MAEQPLQGWRVVVTRAASQAEKLNSALRDAGAEPIPYPTIAYAQPEHLDRLDKALWRLLSGGYEWLVFTSVTGVRFVADRLTALREVSQIPDSLLTDLGVAAVGSATAAACERLFDMSPTVVPETYTAEALAKALGSVAGQEILLPQADIARPTLRDALQQAGAKVDAVVAYHTLLGTGGADVPSLLTAGQISAITFTSPSTVQNFVQRIGAAALPYAQQAVIACIGPVTAEAAEQVGMVPIVQAEPSTVEGLVAGLVALQHGNNT